MNNFELIKDQVDDEYLNFDSVENKLSTRPDLNAFLLLDRLFPNKSRDIISAASHDVFYLDVSDDEIERISKDDALTLIRCGVMCDGYGLSMFA